MKRIKLTPFLCTLLFLITSCSLQPDAAFDKMVDIGTHKLHLQCTGTGRPTIVIDTGIGETTQSWAPMIEALSSERRVCAYDRAGYGKSEPGPMPRDSRKAADELHLLLTNSSEDGPFLLLGHSLGGLNMQVYANNYPDEVNGLILLDPPPLAWMVGGDFPELSELFNQASSALWDAAEEANASTDPDIKAKAAYLYAVASEYKQFFGQTAKSVAEIESFGELPLTVIGAGEPDPHFGDSAQAFRQFWNDENKKLATKSKSGIFILAEGSSHHIHLDAPQVVIEALR